MFKNYFAIAYRSLLKNKLYSAINIFGLAVGLAGFIIIALYIQYQTSWDKMWSDNDRIYRLSRETVNPTTGASVYVANLAGIAAPLLKQDFPEIEQIARVLHVGTTALVNRGDIFINESEINYCDPEIFDIFDIEFIAGDPKTALVNRGTVVITESMARKYFGDEDPMGQVLNIFRAGDVTVTGVVKDMPENSHMDGHMFISILNGNPVILQRWQLNIPHTYIRLAENASIDALEAKFPEFFKRHLGDQAVEQDYIRPWKLTDIHLHSDLRGDMKEGGDIDTVYMFAAIAFFLLLMACINFTNLSTARASLRAREVAMRKVIGAKKPQIVAQFLTESILVAFIAIIIALVFAELTLPTVSTFTQSQLSLQYTDPLVIAGLIVLTLIVGLSAGLYPAFYLSAFRPGPVLKGDLTRGKSGALFRNGLVVLQFGVSIFLLISTIVIFSQMRYTQNMDLGYDRENTLVIRNVDDSGINVNSFRDVLLTDSRITAVAASSSVPTTDYTRPNPVRMEGVDAEALRMESMSISESFFQDYGIEMVAGRAFASDRPADLGTVPNRRTEPITSGAYILNESAVRALGLTNDTVLGKQFEASFFRSWDYRMAGPVIGVVEDFNMQSLKTEIPPVYYYMAPSQYYDISIKMDGSRVSETVSFVRETWQDMVQTYPFDFAFLEDMYNATYQQETRQTIMFLNFTALSIFIACLGLFGLASYTTERRTKEIAVRKVLGASIGDIVLMLSKHFSWLVLISNVIAWPVAYYVMRGWLDNFAYRIDLGVLFFVLGGLVAFMIAWLTVGLHAAKAASMRPANALRYE